MLPFPSIGKTGEAVARYHDDRFLCMRRRLWREDIDASIVYAKHLKLACLLSGSIAMPPSVSCSLSLIVSLTRRRLCSRVLIKDKCALMQRGSRGGAPTHHRRTGKSGTGMAGREVPHPGSRRGRAFSQRATTKGRFRDHFAPDSLFRDKRAKRRQRNSCSLLFFTLSTGADRTRSWRQIARRKESQ